MRRLPRRFRRRIWMNRRLCVSMARSLNLKKSVRKRLKKKLKQRQIKCKRSRPSLQLRMRSRPNVTHQRPRRSSKLREVRHRPAQIGSTKPYLQNHPQRRRLMWRHWSKATLSRQKVPDQLFNSGSLQRLLGLRSSNSRRMKRGTTWSLREIVKDRTPWRKTRRLRGHQKRTRGPSCHSWRRVEVVSQFQVNTLMTYTFKLYFQLRLNCRATTAIFILQFYL